MKNVLTILITTFIGALCGAAPAAGTNSPADLKILSRAEWGAKAPVSPMKAHKPARITIHHTATLQKPERALTEKMKALQEFSQHEGKLDNGKPKPAWPDVPYHYYVDCKGNVAEGRDVAFVGDTNTEYDPGGHVLIVLEGSFGKEQLAEAQLVALRKMILWVATRYSIPPEKIGGHKDFADTQCPGENLYKKLPEFRKLLSDSK